MTREELKEAAKVMEAYANGKEIQCNDNYLGNGEWVTTDGPSFNWEKYAYRIKPEGEYRPFKSQDECFDEMMKHQPFGWFRSTYNKSLFNIVGINDNVIKITNTLYKSKETYDSAFICLEFVDGTPFGVKDE